MILFLAVNTLACSPNQIAGVQLFGVPPTRLKSRSLPLPTEDLTIIRSLERDTYGYFTRAMAMTGKGSRRNCKWVWIRCPTKLLGRGER